MTETGIARVVLGLLQDGARTDFFENLILSSLKETYRMLPLSTHLCATVAFFFYAVIRSQSGNLVVDPWNFGADPDPDPRIHSSD